MEFLYFCLAIMTSSLAILVSFIFFDAVKVLIIKRIIVQDDSRYYLLSSEYAQYFVISNDAVDIGIQFKSKNFHGHKFILFFNKTGKHILRFAEDRKILVITRNVSSFEARHIIHYKDQD